MLRALLPLVLLIACGGDPKGDKKGEVDLGECDGEGPELVLVARELTFARLDESGEVSEGFDLDGGDASIGCGVDDFVDPGGVPDIDNAMAKLVPLLETTEAAALEPIIQDSVNGGALLVMFGLSDFDDFASDECVEVDVFKGLGIPMIGNDGWILPWQTFGVNPDTPVTSAPTAAMIDGRLDIGPIEAVDLSLTILDLDAVATLHNVYIRLEPDAEGEGWSGLLAGGVVVDDIIDVVTLQNVDDAVFELVGPVLELLADLDPDAQGDCQQISMTLQFEAVPAFVYDG